MEKCKVNLNDAYRYLGYTDVNTIDDVTENQIKQLSQQLENMVTPKSVYKVFHIDNVDTDTKTVTLSNTVLKLTGNNITQLLKESDKCILMAITLGQNVDMLIRQTQIRDMSSAVILDACSSSLVEEYCNLLEDNIKETLQEQYGEIYLTDRFSPGYGDLPLDIQNNFCKVIESDKKIGVNVSSTNIMSPKKSITAIIGICNNPQPMRIKGCAYCMLVKECTYKKGGNTCGR